MLNYALINIIEKRIEIIAFELGLHNVYSSNTLAFTGVNIGNVFLLKLEKIRGFKNSPLRGQWIIRSIYCSNTAFIINVVGGNKLQKVLKIWLVSTGIHYICTYAHTNTPIDAYVHDGQISKLLYKLDYMPMKKPYLFLMT